MRLMPLVCAALLAGTGLSGGCSSRREPAAKPRPAGAATHDEAAPAAAASSAPASAATVDPKADAADGAVPADLADLRRQLASASDVPSKVAALDALAATGKRAAPAIDELVAAAGDTDAEVRWHAARALGLVGKTVSSATTTLVTLLHDVDAVVAAQAAHALGLIAKGGTASGTDAGSQGVVEPLIAASTHPDPRVRRAAVKSLRRVATPTELAPLVARHLADADPSVVLPALHTLADMREEAVPLLLAALDEPKARYWAAVAAAEIGPDAAAATQKLTDLAASGELDERMQAIFALAAIGEPAASAAPTLVEALAGKEDMLQFAAAFALGKLRAPAGVEPLTTTAASTDPFLAAIASWALAQIHPEDAALVAEAVGKLRAGLTSPDATVRAGSVNGLADLAADADAETRRTLATVFGELLDDPDAAVGTAAGAALVRLGPAAETVLRGQLGAAATRMRGMEILAAQAEAAAPLVPEMVEALGDDDAAYASEAAVALAAIGPAAAAAEPTLRGLLVETTPAPVRYTAMYALGRIGAAAKESVPRLLELSRSDDELEATVAVWAALKIQPEDKSLFDAAIPRLQKALLAQEELARLEAAVSLGDIGPAASAAVATLELLAEDDPSRAVRSAAAAALEKLRSP
jgi:HEAT repeat protein